MTYFYADDSSLLIRGKTEKQLSEKRTKILKRMEDWFASNYLNSNEAKTQHMHFSNKKEMPTKLLRLYIRSDLSWKMHVSKILSKLNSAIYCLRGYSKK